MLVLSVKRLILIGVCKLRINKPLIILSLQVMHAKGLMARSKMGHDMGSPCWIPWVTLKGLLNIPLMATIVDAFL